MNPGSIDWKSMGLKIGIEIHQQLNTRKLFCNCPSEIRDDEADVIVTRKLRASAGETGETDIAAEYEMKKERHFVYHAYNNTVCAVELDEEPIHSMNKEALNAVLQFAAMANAKPVDKIQVMRKTVIDGSNTSGFQRTALVARNGRVDAKSKSIQLQTICIEEESAKIIDSTPDFVTYNLSRLGIPLIEVATGPDIETPEQAKEVAEHIGMMLRSTGKVKRGLGTIRQDINVSIKGGARVEIKGAQELKLLPKLAETEALRQKNLIEISEELKERKAGISKNITDITDLLHSCESELIQNTIKKNGAILAVKLKGFSGIVNKEIQPGRRLGREFSEHARAEAGAGGAMHSDELPKLGITEKEVKAIKHELECKEDDAFIFVADERETAEKALHAIIKRAEKALHGVPEEVRKANPDGTTSFLRPMPGSARMYPETDTTAITPDLSSINQAELITDKAAKYGQMGLSKDLATQISKSEFAHEFEKIAGKFKNTEPAFIAATILNTAKEIKKRYNLEAEISSHDMEAVLEKLDNRQISKEAVLEIFVEKAKGAKLEDSIAKYAQMPDDEIEAAIKKIIDENKSLPQNALIGKAMEKLRGKAEGKKVVEMLRKMQ